MVPHYFGFCGFDRDATPRLAFEIGVAFTTVEARTQIGRNGNRSRESLSYKRFLAN